MTPTTIGATIQSCVLLTTAVTSRTEFCINLKIICHDMDTIWYAINIAIFDMILCIVPALVQYQEGCLACKKPVPLIPQDSLLEQLKDDNERGDQANPDSCEKWLLSVACVAVMSVIWRAIHRNTEGLWHENKQRLRDLDLQTTLHFRANRKKNCRNSRKWRSLY